MKNIWKYLFLLGFFSLVGTLLYVIFVVIFYDINSKVPLWFELWIKYPFGCLFLSAVLAFLGNLKGFWSTLKEFLE